MTVLCRGLYVAGFQQLTRAVELLLKEGVVVEAEAVGHRGAVGREGEQGKLGKARQTVPEIPLITAEDRRPGAVHLLVHAGYQVPFEPVQFVQETAGEILAAVMQLGRAGSTIAD